MGLQESCCSLVSQANYYKHGLIKLFIRVDLWAISLMRGLASLESSLV